MEKEKEGLDPQHTREPTAVESLPNKERALHWVMANDVTAFEQSFSQQSTQEVLEWVFEIVLSAVLHSKPQCVKVLAPRCDLDPDRTLASPWVLTERSRNFRVALLGAIERNCVASLDALMQAPGLDIEKLFGRKSSPLLRAVKGGHLPAIPILARHELPSTGAAGTALLLAMKLRFPTEEALGMIQALLPGCDVLAVYRDASGVEHNALNEVLARGAYPEADAIGLHMPMEAVQDALQRAGKGLEVLPQNQARQERKQLASALGSKDGGQEETNVTIATNIEPADAMRLSTQPSIGTTASGEPSGTPQSSSSGAKGRKGLRL